MKIIIRNAEQDTDVNKAENIFIAFDENNEYLGYGYVYPSFNYDISYKHPHNIYIDMNVESNIQCWNSVMDALFERIMKRAHEIRDEHNDINARIYGGCFASDTEKIQYYISKRLADDEGTHLYEKYIARQGVINKEVDGIEITEYKIEQEHEKLNFIQVYNSINNKKIDSASLEEMMSEKLWNNFSVFLEGKMVGNIMVYERVNKDNEVVGYIENIFVAKEYRNKGIAKQLLNKAFKYFIDNGIEICELEVWSVNERAVNLYKSMGFEFIRETEIYPGINL